MRRPWQPDPAPRRRPGSRFVPRTGVMRPGRTVVAALVLLAVGCAPRPRVAVAPPPAARDAGAGQDRARDFPGTGADAGSRQRSGPALEPYNRGVAALARGRLAEAETAFASALELAPSLEAARYNLALVWMKRGAYERAEPALRALAASHPRDPDILFAHGNTLFHQARFAEAAAVFHRLRKVAPAHREGAFSLARSLQEAGRRDEARAAWEAYLRLDADSSWADVARQALRDLRGE